MAKRTYASATLAVIIVLGAILLYQSAFIVDQTEKAVVVQLGRPVGGVKSPGLHFKLPMVQNVIYFDARLLDYDANPAELLTKDKKTMVVDNYAKWRIADPLRFLRTVNNITQAQGRLNDVIYSQIREVLGTYTLIQIVKQDRAEIMAAVTSNSNNELGDYGIEVLDVRIKATDLPEKNRAAIFERMRAERIRQAKQYRSEGREAGDRIRAMADKERTVILAEAKREADTLRGQGDSQAVSIYAAAVNQAPEFYEFRRSMEAYEKALGSKTKMVLTPDTPFLKYLGKE